MNLQVGYYDPFDIYPVIQPSIESKLPLTNLHWKIDNTMKSIPKLPIDLVEEVPKKMKKSVSLRIMFIKSGDMATYKSQVRPLIKEWLKSQPQDEWLIVLHSPVRKDSKYSLKTSIYEKLKTDFNKDGKELASLQISSGGIDRCFRLKETNDNELNKLEIYNEFIGKLKQLILNGFTNKITKNNEMMKQAEGSNNHLMAINLLISLCRYYQELYLFKESLSFLNELSYKYKQYYKTAHYEHDLSIINFQDVFKTLVACGEDVDLLNESNSFKIFSFIFYQKHSVLFKMIQNEPLVSLRAQYLTTLYQELIQYLNEVSTIFKGPQNDRTSALILVYRFKMIVHYLEFKEVNEIVQAGRKSNDIDLSNIYEFMGDLKLSQRDGLIKLAELKGYFFTDSDEMESIALNPNSDDVSKILTSMDEYDKSLSKILDTKETYFRYFHSLTESIIQNFVPCGRIKSIDVLSIDLALLNYHQGNYQQVINVLQDSFEYFITNGWNYMGNKLLKIYINSVEKLIKPNDNNDSLLLINSYIKLTNNLKLSTGKFDINCQVTSNLNESVNSILNEKILPLCDSLSTELVIPLDSIFEVSVLPKFDFSRDKLKYFLSLEVSNKFDIRQTLQSVSLELSNGLVLTNEDVDLEASMNKDTQTALIDVFTSVFIKGFYNPLKLKVSLSKKLSLVHEFKIDQQDEPVEENVNNTVNQADKPETHVDAVNQNDEKVKHRRNSILNNSMLMDNKIFISEHNQLVKSISDHSLYFHEISNTFKVEIEFAKSYLLGSPLLSMRLINGYTTHDVKDVSIEYLQLDGFKFVDNVAKETTKDIANESSIQLEKALNVISDGDCFIKVKVKYTMNGNVYEYYYDTIVNCKLIISVTVQDIFKTDSIFSNFQIGSIIDSPLRVNSIKLDPVDSEDNKVVVESPSVPLKNEIILKDQILNSFYKLTVNNIGSEYRNGRQSDQLQLNINYNSLVYECRSHLEDVVATKIGIPVVSELFKDIVIPICKYEYNSFLIDNTLSIRNKAEVLKVVEGIKKYVPTESSNDKSSGTEPFIFKLIDIIKCDHLLDLSNDKIINNAKNELRIMVPLPHIDLLQVVEFRYSRQNQYLVGEPIEMELVIESNTKWEQASKELKGPKKLSTPGETQEDISIIAESSSMLDDISDQVHLFQFSLINDENWSVTGFKKKLLQVNLGDPVTTNRFSLLLIPLTIGKLSLPKFFLKLVDQSINHSVDISFKNGNETLLVVPELDKITFSF